MSRLVVVSNRVTPITGSKAATAGGLAVGVLAALRETGGIWFGWSGETIESGTPIPKVVRTGNITYITIDLLQADFDRYYGGFANRTLWPLFHYRLDLVELRSRLVRRPTGGSTSCSPSSSTPICATTT